MTKWRLTLAAICMISLSVIAPVYAGDSTLIGTGVGAAVGGLFGSQFGHGSSQVASTGIGIAVGGVIGNSIGQSMEYANAHTYGNGGGGYMSSEAPAPITYQAYSANYVAPPAPPPIYVSDDGGTYCREFSQRVRINGRLQEAYGTACLQPDGSWRIVR